MLLIDSCIKRIGESILSGAECLVLLCAAIPSLASGVGGCAGAGRTSLAALFHSSEAGAKKGGTAVAKLWLVKLAESDSWLLLRRSWLPWRCVCRAFGNASRGCELLSQCSIA